MATRTTDDAETAEGTAPASSTRVNREPLKVLKESEDSPKMTDFFKNLPGGKRKGASYQKRLTESEGICVKFFTSFQIRERVTYQKVLLIIH